MLHVQADSRLVGIALVLAVAAQSLAKDFVAENVRLVLGDCQLLG